MDSGAAVPERKAAKQEMDKSRLLYWTISADLRFRSVCDVSVGVSGAIQRHYKYILEQADFVCSHGNWDDAYRVCCRYLLLEVFEGSAMGLF